MSSAPASMRTTEPRPATRRVIAARALRGISLVELMVGMTIGLIALLVMMQTFSASSGHKANTVSGADATTAGHIALTLIERDLLSAGAGFSATGCTEIRQYKGAGNLEKFGFPVIITAGTGTAASRSDRVTIYHSSSAEVGASSKITQNMPTPATTMFGSGLLGFADDDLVLLYAPGKHCVVLQLTDAPKWSGGKAHFAMANNQSPYNEITKNNAKDADGNPLFPENTYMVGVGKILSLGPAGITSFEYSLSFRDAEDGAQNSDLQVRRADAAGTVTAPVARDVIALRAQYGWWDSGTSSVSFSSDLKAGAAPTDLVAVRVGVLVRASRRDAAYTAPEKVQFFAYDNPIEITLGAEERKYRYRSYETVVPLRNSLWNRE